jgi:hypothetical protein
MQGRQGAGGNTEYRARAERSYVYLQRKRPAPAHPAPGQRALVVVVQGVGACRVAAVVVRAGAVVVAAADGVEAPVQE